MSEAVKTRIRRLRAFTLTECLVALAILGIATLTMATVYSAVARMSRDNEFMNISLSEQMKYVEARTKYDNDATNTTAVVIEGTPASDEKTTHVVDDKTYRVFITGGPRQDNGTLGNSTYTYSNYEYEYGVNMYILYSRDVKDTSSQATTGYVWDEMYNDDSNGKLRFKYLLPRAPSA
ncbi:MAG: type II secretion system GspH family protein [Ruminococcus sp.]|jgi:prepilin-type N-terminal cleavage/methylation domain-containing protein|nr:type II secretion system GspH family protein [Ruminococcus sp.]